ncbi:MAG TPA: hypothetical protein VFV54_07025 [Thermoanaerobaculia bacterium]|nr:hypothetical protein [Thermoanaerobaculia bacterium]
MKPVYQRKQRPAHDSDFAGAARALSRTLLAVHKQLLERARIDYEKAHGRQTPTQLWQLLIEDPFFAWLRPLSGAVAQLDELLATDTDRAPYRSLAGEVRRMLTSGDPADPFAAQYSRFLQVPEVIEVHVAARRALEAFEAVIEK